MNDRLTDRPTNGRTDRPHVLTRRRRVTPRGTCRRGGASAPTALPRSRYGRRTIWGLSPTLRSGRFCPTTGFMFSEGETDGGWGVGGVWVGWGGWFNRAVAMGQCAAQQYSVTFTTCPASEIHTGYIYTWYIICIIHASAVTPPYIFLSGIFGGAVGVRSLRVVAAEHSWYSDERYLSATALS